ncbi:MAG: hypothetical protein WDM80_01335 [Limisphaerales bacterium]
MPTIILLWIWCCAYLNCVGWTLSALHQLNARGYTVALALGAVALLIWRKQTSPQFFPKVRWQKYVRRFRKPFPLAFLILATLAFLGGALHAASNYDALAYRTPRVLHWLAEGQWHWIHTVFQRLNTRTAGFEWLTAPQFLFFHTDRLVFLINIISFLLLPGRFFAVLTRLGVRPRAAWHWMWLFASGYGYVLQAGSVANDMFGALLALTAIEFALRARLEKSDSYFWVSGLAAALMTASKAFNILLLLPWALAALPSFKLLLRRPLASALVILFAMGASLVPTAMVNIKNCSDWTGLKAEGPAIGGGGGASFRFLANSINLPLANLVPPIFPFTKQWEHLVQRLVPAPLADGLQKNLEAAAARFQIQEMQMEESAGLGAGVTLLVLVVLVRKIRAGKIWPAHFFRPEIMVPLGAWAGVGVFMVQVGVSGSARYLLPFYPLLVAPVLAGAGANLFRRPLWRTVALGVFASSALLLIVTPPRPLWPAKTILRSFDAEHANSYLLKRAWNVYAAYSARTDGFNPVIAVLPAEANPLGYMAFDEPETGLWRPFGSRRLEHFTQNDSAEDLRARGVKFALVSEDFLTQHAQMKTADWLVRMDAEPLQHFELKLLARQEPHGWLLVRFR